jgi:heme-degrading monooxygenase HmoA
LVLFGAPAPTAPPSHEPPLAQRYLHLDHDGELEGFEAKVRDTQHLDSAMFEAWMNAYLATDAQSRTGHPASVRIPAGLMAAANDMDRLGQLPYDPQQITVPVLVIQGEWDEVAPPAAGLWIYQRLASPLKRFVIISQAGHRAHLEKNRGQLYRETETFLNGGDSADGPRYAVFFEVKPNGDGGRKAYLDTAGALRSKLDTISGFVSIERFDNESRPGWLLSLSHWRDEAALITWREVFEHRVAQEKGRHGVFADYRIRVARQVAAGGDLTVADETNCGPGTGTQRFASLSTPGHRVALIEGGGLPGGTHWQVIRDYGLHQRRQAPHE